MQRGIMPQDGASALLKNIRHLVRANYVRAAMLVSRTVAHLLFLKEAAMRLVCFLYFWNWILGESQNDFTLSFNKEIIRC